MLIKASRTILKTLPATILASTVLQAPIVSAGGLWINEYGSPVMGRAGAGAEAGTDDASASFHNPSSMTRLKDEQLMLTGGLIYAEVEFQLESSGTFNGNVVGGNAGDIAPAFSAFYASPLNDDLWVGFSFAALTGTLLDFSDQWVGRFQAQKVDIVGLALSPSIAYKVNDKLSIGFALPIFHTEVELRVATPDQVVPTFQEGQAQIDGDDTVIGYNLNFLYEFTDQTRLGVFYQSEFGLEFDGDFTKQPQGANASVSPDLDLAAKAYAGLTHELNDTISLHATFGWEDWSTLDNILIATDAGTDVIPRNWDDTYKYAIGINYALSQQTRLNGGLAYDTNPVDSVDRVADMPIDRQVRYAFGVEHDWNGGPSLAAQLVYTDLGSAKINAVGPFGPALSSYKGHFDTNHVVFFAISANWQLGDE